MFFRFLMAETRLAFLFYHSLLEARLFGAFENDSASMENFVFN